MKNKPTRPVVRYHGGKWKLAPWIIMHFPAHRVYVEPFGGAGSVLIRKPRSYAEIYNDLDLDVVNLFRVLQDRKCAEQLRQLIHLTPFARAEFEGAYEPKTDPIGRAQAFIIRAFMGFGSASSTSPYQTGFRANSNRSGTTPAHDWTNWPDQIPLFVERLRGVVIENEDAITVMNRHDTKETLHYVDPPYMWSTREKTKSSALPRHSYKFEMCEGSHQALAETLNGLKGMVVLSGYASDHYADWFKGWTMVERQTHADGDRDRTEVLWMNPACIKNAPSQRLL